MRHTWSDSNRFAQSLYFPKEEIDLMCEQELKKAGFFPNSPSSVNIELFIEKHYGYIEYLDLGEGVLGCTKFNSKGEIEGIIISSALTSEEKTTERRLRSTLAHEAGHCMLHPILFIQDGLQTTFKNENEEIARERRFLCRSTDIFPVKDQDRTWNGKWWEYQANRAIGGFLLPKNLVKKVVAPFLEKTGIIDEGTLTGQNRLSAIKVVSETFDVNPKAAEIRISEMYPLGNQQLTL